MSKRDDDTPPEGSVLRGARLGPHERKGPRPVLPREPLPREGRAPDVPRRRELPVPGLPPQAPTLLTVTTPAPTLATVSAQNDKILGELAALRKHIIGDPQILRLPPIPMPTFPTPSAGTPMQGGAQVSTPAPPSSPESRPSLAVRAANAAKEGGTKWGKRGTMALGVAVLLAQLAAPLIAEKLDAKYSGPIVQILRILVGVKPTP